MPRYSIRKNRLKSGYKIGFEQTGDNGLKLDPDNLFHTFILKGIDGAEQEDEWGRLSFKAVCSEDVVYSIYVMASDHKDFLRGDQLISVDAFMGDEEVDPPVKIEVFKSLGAKRFIGTDDILLYDLKGRYLYIALDVTGEGEAFFSDMVVDSEGDNFMNTFPEIYKERNSLFHRYMSIFSSIYNDFQREIDRLPWLLDLDTCPAELLPIYGSWMGLDLSGDLLDEDILRTFVKEAYELGRMKGTRKAIERVLEILLGEPAIVVEHNSVRAWIQENRDSMGSLPDRFKPKGIYDVTVLIKGHLTEELRHRIMFMLDQFKPVRTHINIAQMDESVIIDSNSYLDMNAKLPEEKGAILDENFALDGTVTLK